MGLDRVELRRAIEAAFKIAISDAEAARVLTAGDLQALILSKIPGDPSSVGLTTGTFCQLRWAMMRIFNLRRSQVRPSTPLGPLMPLWRRRALWRRLEQTAQLRLPALEPPLWAHLTLIVAAISVAIAPIFFGVMPANPLVLGVFLLVVALVAYRVLLRVTPIMRVAFPMRPATAGTLARAALSLNQSALAFQKNAHHEEEVWSVTRRIIAAQMQIDSETIHPDDPLETNPSIN